MSGKEIAVLAAMYLAGVCPGEAQSLQSLVNPTSSGTISIAATFSTLRTEFRIENFSAAGSIRYVWAVGNFPGTYCALNAGGLNLGCQFGGDGTPDGGTVVDLTGRNDVRVRWQRDPNAGTYQFELWNGDCTGYSTITRRLTNPIPPNVFTGPLKTGDSMQLAFVRLYSQLDSSGACPSDAPAATADMLDMRFDGTLTDSSGHGYVLNASGTSFVPSKLYPPLPVITGPSTSRSAQLLVLDGSRSITFVGNGAPKKYFWQQVAGPVSNIGNHTATTLSATPPVAGQYTYRLTITDSAGTVAQTDHDVGVVATDSLFVLSNPGAALGSGVMEGKSAWPWYEATEMADADLLANLMQTPPSETPQSGTLYAPTGTGINNLDRDGQIVAGAYGGVAWVGSGTNFDQTWVGKSLAVRWDPEHNGTYKGRHVVPISQVINATTIVSPEYYLPGPGTRFNSGGLSWSLVDSESYDRYRVSNNASWLLNFYEAGLGVGRLYTRTGLTKYQTQFHSFCDNWWRWALDSGNGYSNMIPRNAGLPTMIACAADPTYPTPAGMWGGIANLTSFMGGYVPTVTGNQQAINLTSTASRALVDVREFSYVTRPTALLARLYGAHGGSTSTWCTYLANQVNNMWIGTATDPRNASPGVYAFWGEDLYAFSVYPGASSPAGDPRGIFGTSPWRSAGLPALALIYAYEALADVTACNNQALARQLFNTSDGGLISRVANYIWSYGRSADGGLLYNEGYENTFISPLWVDGAGTLSVANGSTAVTGAGTSFTTLFAPCDGTTYIAIPGRTDRRVYQVTACADATHLTLGLPYAGVAETGMSGYSRTRKATTSCGPLSVSTHCEPDFYNGRNLAADVGASAAWLYAHTGSTTWKARAEFYANKTFGGPAKGSGAQGPPTGSCVYGRPGTVTVVNGGYTLTGSGTQFQTQFACNGSDSITIADGSGGYTWAKPPGATPMFYTVPVASCASQTSLTLGSPYPGTSGGNIAMFYNAADPQWQCADGGTGNLGEILPVCSVNAPPCGSNQLVPKYGKSLGMAAGAGNTPALMADLLSTTPVAARTILLDFKLAAVPHASQVRVALTNPRGDTAQTICASAPCLVSVNPTLGNLLLGMEYLSSSGAVLASGEPVVLRIQ
jgi:hypothetical protein